MGVGVICPKCRATFAYYCSNCHSYDTEIYETPALANYFQTGTIYYFKCRACQFEYDNVICPECNTRILPEQPFVTGDKGRGTAKKCFIATACLGENTQIVKQLCFFRNEVLDKNFFGEKFIKSYYKFSPKLASCLLKNNLLRSLAKYLLVYPAFYISLMIMKINSLYKEK